MCLDFIENGIATSVEYLVNVGSCMNDSYNQMCPTQKAVGMYNMLLAARNVCSQVTRAVRFQEMSILDVASTKVMYARYQLATFLTSLEQSDCDLGISYSYNGKSPMLVDPEEIVDEENLDLLFPEMERTSGFENIRKFLIGRAKDLYFALVDCLKMVLDKLMILVSDHKKLKHDPELRMARMEAMERNFFKNVWPKEKAWLLGRIEDELRDEVNAGVTEVKILTKFMRKLKEENEAFSMKESLQHINEIRENREEVARELVVGCDDLSFEDVMSHLRYRESMKLLKDRIELIKLQAPCDAYQGRLFVNNAAYQVAKMLGRFFYNYVGFDKKVKAAFSCAAMMDAGMIIEENNARLMAEFINNEWLGENDGLVKDDDITKPLRKCAKRPFCTIDENNLRSFESKEFLRYKDSYWRAFSIINKVLVISENLEKAAYLDEIHPAIEDIDVESSLADDEKDVLKIINSDAGLKWG